MMSEQQFYALTISALDYSTEDALTISLQLPSELSARFDYQAGQFLTVRVLIDGEPQQRAYSLNSSPAVAEPLQITVKRVSDGLVSNYLHDHLQVGDLLKVAAPQGRFVQDLQPTNQRSYYLFAAGSGITPIVSMVKTILTVEPWSHIYMLYGSRDEEHIVLRQELEQWQQRYAERFTLVQTLSQPNSQKWSALLRSGERWQGEVGRIDADKVRAFIDQHPPAAQRARYLICGPGEMINAIEQALLALDVDGEDILVEHFGVSGSLSDSPQGCAAQLAVNAYGTPVQVDVAAGQSLLQALLDQQVEVPYGCQSGVCGSCQAQLTKGEVHMVNAMALTDKERQAGAVLLCQCQAKSAKLAVKLTA